MKAPYPRMYVRGHKNVRRTHVVIAERALGRSLPKGAQVHHVNEDKTDNNHKNLVICPDAAYHKLLHRRAEALDICGNANWVKCCFCKKFDAPENVKYRKSHYQWV